jgi:DNA-binding transcriptional regulator YdaS (Cro superfamily)
MHNLDALNRAIDAAGGPSALARRIGVTPSAVTNWTKLTKRLSPHNAVRIENTTGVPREELRPDLFRRSAA